MNAQTNGAVIELTDNQILRQLALRWKDRREAMEISVKTKRHAEQQLSFFLGACHAMELAGRNFPRFALIMLSVGRDSVILWGEPK